MSKLNGILMGLLFCGAIVALGAAIAVVVSVGANFISTSTPDQAVQLGTYVQSSGITLEQSEITENLAEADATVRYAQNDRIRANAELMYAENDRMKVASEVLGLDVRGMISNVFVCALALVGLILLLVILSRRKKASPPA